MKTIFKKMREVFAHKKPIYKTIFFLIHRCHIFEGTNPSLSPSFQQFGQTFRENVDLIEQLTAEIEEKVNNTQLSK